MKVCCVFFQRSNNDFIECKKVAVFIVMIYVRKTLPSTCELPHHGVNFTNILCAALTSAEPKSVKKTSQVVSLFTL
jgi:hypothetical protein